MAFPNPADPGPTGPSGPELPSSPAAAPATYPGAAPPSGPRPFPSGPATEPWSPPPETKPSRASIYIAVGAVIVAVLVILGALFAVGAFSTKSPPTGPMTFRTAEGEVTNYLNSYHGGNWNILLGAGVAPPVAFSGKLDQSLGSLFGGSGCNTTWLVANGTALTAGPVTSDLGQGKASLWLFAAANTTGYLVILNVEGQVMPILTLTCASPPTALLTVPGNAIDSSQAEQAAYAAGEQAFVTAHPGGTAALTITPGFAFGGVSLSSRWEVLYQACAPPANASTAPSGPPVPTFNASINSVTGQVIAHNITQMPCGNVGLLSSIGTPGGGGSTPLGTAFGMGSPTLFQGTSSGVFPPCAPGDYCYAVPIVAAVAGLEASNVLFQVETSTGGLYTLPSAGGVSIQDLSGAAVVKAPVAAGPFFMTAWTPGGGAYTTASVQLTSTMTVEVDLGSANPAGQGLSLVATGVSGYSGTVSITLP